MTKLSDLELSTLKIQQAQEKLRILTQRGQTIRDDDVKYWREQLRNWQAYAAELQQTECPNCHADIILGKTIMGNGLYHVKAVCYICGANVKGNGGWFKKSVMPQEILDGLAVFDDYSKNAERCAVKGCTEIGSEYHHWAPKEFFPDTSEQWPTSYLCKKHHDEWHKKITDPFRVLRNKQEVINGR